MEECFSHDVFVLGFNTKETVYIKSQGCRNLRSQDDLFTSYYRSRRDPGGVCPSLR
jgi:hypothetical protein